MASGPTVTEVLEKSGCDPLPALSSDDGTVTVYSCPRGIVIVASSGAHRRIAFIRGRIEVTRHYTIGDPDAEAEAADLLDTLLNPPSLEEEEE